MDLRKIIREEIGLEWIQEEWIEGKELRELLLQTGADTIPFKEVRGNLNLYGTAIKDLGSLQYVRGDLNLGGTAIKDLGSLQTVNGYLYLRGTPIKDLGSLQSVGGDLYIGTTPVSKKYSEREIRAMVNVQGNIYLW